MGGWLYHLTWERWFSVGMSVRTNIFTRIRRSFFVPAPRTSVKNQFFSGTQLQHRFAVRFLQLLELALILLPHVLGLGTQGVLHPALAVIKPTLDL